MNLRQFLGSIMQKAGKATPELARQIVESLKAAAIADSPETKRLMHRMNNTAADSSRTSDDRRVAARRRQKASRAEQRRRGIYGRAQS